MAVRRYGGKVVDSLGVSGAQEQDANPSPGSLPAYHPTARPPTAIDVDRIRQDFPILGTTVHGKPLVYLDNAATSQKPRSVIEAMVQFYTSENANIHRGVHHLSERATRAYESVREKVARFIGARSPREIVFTRGTTEAI